jgi:hypothetical protein
VKAAVISMNQEKSMVEVEVVDIGQASKGK